MTDTLSKRSVEIRKMTFTHFPLFAKFLLENHLIEYIKYQIEISKEIDLPILRHFSHYSDEELINMSIESNKIFLNHVISNTLDEQVTLSLKRWVTDDLEIIGRDQIVAGDITLIPYMRSKAMMKFVPLYTSSVSEAVTLMNEINEFSSISTTVSVDTYMSIVEDRIYTHTRFIESITNTFPGLIYVFDLLERREVYTNKTLTDFLGYTREDLAALGNTIIEYLVHPEDAALMQEYEVAFQDIGDGEIRTLEFRVKTKFGYYKWVRTYESVLRRSDDGFILQKIGVAIDIDNQKRAEIQLATREQQLLEAQSLAEMGSYEVDIATEQLTVSPNFLKIAELPEGMSRSDYANNVHPGDLERVNAELQQAIEEGTTYDYEYRYHINGKEKIIWSRGKLYEENNKKIIKGTITDVTYKHHMVQKLQRSETLYKQAQALSHIGNYTYDIRNDKLEWTDEIYRIFGLEPQSMPIDFKTFINFVHSNDRKKVAYHIKASIEKAQPHNFHYKISLPDGTEKILQAIGDVLVDKNNIPYKFIGTVQDVTEKQTLIENLQNKNDFIEKVTNATPSIITIYDIRSGQYTFVNKGIETLLGYISGDILSGKVSFTMSLLHPEDIDMYKERIRQFIDNANDGYNDKEPVLESKFRIKNVNGNYRWLHAYTTIFDRDESGKVLHLLNISVDNTDYHLAEQELHQKNIQLQQSNSSLEEYAYVASHDLNEPLRKIATFGDRLMATQHKKLSDDGKMYLEKIIQSSRRMQTMISDLLSVSMIYGNKAFAMESLQQILYDVMQTLEYKIEEKHAIIKSDELPKVRIVASQFRQLLQNLISNSLKFTMPDVIPSIHITHRFLSPKDVENYNISMAHRYLQIDVEDNGIGFDEQFSGKIFNIFQRLHGRSEYEGTGIGLAICKKIAENHGGTIFAHSRAGEGATFTIIIPVL